jgi:hypothetical protein
MESERVAHPPARSSSGSTIAVAPLAVEKRVVLAALLVMRLLRPLDPVLEEAMVGYVSGSGLRVD